MEIVSTLSQIWSHTIFGQDEIETNISYRMDNFYFGSAFIYKKHYLKFEQLNPFLHIGHYTAGIAKILILK